FVDKAGGTMRKLVLFGMVGVLAQLIDGALGMASGPTSTTMLVAVGTVPAVASATVHLAELGTTAVSGGSHWRFGNVDWRTVRLMTFPGAVGAFTAGVAGVLLVPGVYVLLRFLGTASGPRPRAGRPLPSALLAPLGLGAGFLDAVGGGGWGPVGTPPLLASGRLEPRKVIGSVDTGEFLVALGASAGFLVSLSWRQVPLGVVLLLLAGGPIPAPPAPRPGPRPPPPPTESWGWSGARPSCSPPPAPWPGPSGSTGPGGPPSTWPSSPWSGPWP